MDDGSRLWLGLVICSAIVAIMNFFSLCENAAVEFNDAKLKKLAEEDPRAKRLETLLEQPARLMNANVISRLVMTLIISTVATICFFEPLVSAICTRFKISGTADFKYILVNVISFIILLSVTALIIAVFGINMPQKLVTSGKVGESFILRCQGIYKIWLYLFKPLEVLNNIFSKVILRIFGVKEFKHNDAVTEEEILLMVDAVNETGAIEESQAEMISNIFEFDDLEIREVMTHRTEVLALEQQSPVTDAVTLALEEGFSRIPVFEESIDNIVGVVFVKDLLKFVLEDNAKNHTVKEYMREILFVPESNSCREVFKEFTEQKIQIAVAVDDYGGTAGIITMEDLIETIVGNIQDEYDNEAEEILEISDGVFDVLGNADYEDVFEAVGLTSDENSDYETIGGFIIDKLGRIPKQGETPDILWENVKFKVLSAKDNKIVKLRATVTEGKAE